MTWVRKTYGFAPTGVAASSGCGGIGSATTDSQSQPSFKQLRTVPIFVLVIGTLALIVVGILAVVALILLFSSRD